ncbi:uncharacterized protein LAJ45_08389 [Morchella importuna]|uniref:uncharacterized protein n=1 Tax=Morchella importuna TaxID=1174673 RepID=UPI001E8CC0AF|nr:uncharacterized protein LAJ45_08389 [Morchella importuna]KAH8147562.1 hypothetical protein LAJ45_08389 [Morchella importuna]
MGWKERSIYAWHTLLSLSFFASLTLALLDTEAASQKIDSVYVGKLSAAWIDADHTEGCGERLLGVLDNTNLTFGPVHDNTTDHSNPYFISLASPQTENLTVTMQSSISSENLGAAWWSVAAELDDDDEEYKITGTLKNTKNLSNNKFSGNFGSGGLEDGDIEFEIEGSMVDGDTGRTIAYTIQFHGKWDSGTAKLNFSSNNPTWPKAGTGESDTTTAAKTSGILVDTGPTPTGSAEKDDDDKNFMDDISKKLGLGGVVGVISGGVILLGIVGALIFCAVNRRKRHREAGRVYPEVAYIYTPSPDLDGSYPGSYRSNSELDMREVLVNDYSLPVTNQHQWRQF